MTLRIEQMYAFVASDDEGEGVCATMLGDVWYPMVAADMERIEQLRPHAEALATVLGKEITLAQFTFRKDLETINP